MSLTIALKKSIALKQDIYGYMRVPGTPHELIQEITDVIKGKVFYLRIILVFRGCNGY